MKQCNRHDDHIFPWVPRGYEMFNKLPFATNFHRSPWPALRHPLFPRRTHHRPERILHPLYTVKWQGLYICSRRGSGSLAMIGGNSIRYTRFL